MELQMLAWTHHPARHSKQIESAIDAGIGLYRCLDENTDEGFKRAEVLEEIVRKALLVST